MAKLFQSTKQDIGQDLKNILKFLHPIAYKGEMKFTFFETHDDDEYRDIQNAL